MIPVKIRKKNQKPEAEFKKAVREYMQIAYGQHFFRLAIAGGPYQRNGSPDEVWSVRGIFIAPEFKAPGKHLRDNQLEIVDEIIRAGGRAGRVSNWDELKSLLDGIEPVQKCLFGMGS
jgi:hypothetical protein